MSTFTCMYVCACVHLSVWLQVNVALTISDQQDHCPFLTVNPLSVTRDEGDIPGDIGVTITAEDRDSTGSISTLSLLPAGSPFELVVTGLDTSLVVSLTMECFARCVCTSVCLCGERVSMCVC